MSNVLKKMLVGSAVVVCMMSENSWGMEEDKPFVQNYEVKQIAKLKTKGKCTLKITADMEVKIDGITETKLIEQTDGIVQFIQPKCAAKISVTKAGNVTVTITEKTAAYQNGAYHGLILKGPKENEMANLIEINASKVIQLAPNELIQVIPCMFNKEKTKAIFPGTTVEDFLKSVEDTSIHETKDFGCDYDIRVNFTTAN